VLVAGLGLGIVVEYLKKNKRVRSITVVEKYREVVEIVKKLHHRSSLELK
jgi:spermidine synthase